MTDVPQPNDPRFDLAGGHTPTSTLPHVPPGWYEAEQEAPHADDGPEPRGVKRRVAAVPIRRETPLVAVTVAAIGGIVAVLGWYFAEVLDAYDGPWTPIGAAIVIGVPVGLFSRAEPSSRSLASVGTYMLVVLISLMMLTHRDLVATYDWLEDYQIYEYSAIHGRLRDPFRLGIYGLGAVIAAILPRLAAHR